MWQVVWPMSNLILSSVLILCYWTRMLTKLSKHSHPKQLWDWDVIYEEKEKNCIISNIPWVWWHNGTNMQYLVRTLQKQIKLKEIGAHKVQCWNFALRTTGGHIFLKRTPKARVPCWSLPYCIWYLIGDANFNQYANSLMCCFSFTDVNFNPFLKVPFHQALFSQVLSNSLIFLTLSPCLLLDCDRKLYFDLLTIVQLPLTRE